jgi:nucleoside-diphosphate-sugar epimerase
MNILVTGANGFLGSNICNLLSKNHNIYAASRTFTKLSKHNIVCIRSEMSDYITLNETIKDNKIDTVIHCAWMGGNSSKDTNELWQTENISYSTILLEACAKHKIKHFIGFGSSAEYGNQNTKFNEDTTCSPTTMYGVSKNCFKMISENYCKSNNILHSWIRPVYTYGPNDVETRLIPKVILSLLKNQNLTLNKCSAVVDYLYVEDFAKAVKIIVEEKLQGNYTVCSDGEIDIRNVVTSIYNKINPSCVLNFDDEIEEIGPKSVCGTSQKLRSVSNWFPEIDFEQGLEQTISYFKKFV